jgi:hypothetical protein
LLRRERRHGVILTLSSLDAGFPLSPRMGIPLHREHDATLRSQARTSEIIRGIRFVWALLIDAIIGVVLIFLTNLFLSPPIPINLLTILISAIGGVIGWLIILILHLLGVAFV